MITAENRHPGRPKGALNKTSSMLKDAILEAAMEAGGGKPNGLKNYLKDRAEDAPAPFMGLLGKVLPLQVSGDPDNPINHKLAIEVAFSAGEPK